MIEKRDRIYAFPDPEHLPTKHWKTVEINPKQNFMNTTGCLTGVSAKAVKKEYPLLLLTAFIWGSGHPVIKIILRELSSIQIAMLSSTLGTLALMLILGFERRFEVLGSVRGRVLAFTFFSGIIMFFLYPILSFSALQKIPASTNSILVATSTIFVALISALVLDEKLGRLNYSGVLVAFTGVVFVVTSTGGMLEASSLNIFGCLLSLAGAVSMASYTVMGRRILASLDPMAATFIASLSGSIFLIILVGATEGYRELATMSLMTVALTLYWGILGGICYFFFYYCLKRIEATRASSFTYFSPLFAVLLSHFILREEIKTFFVLGMVLILTGVWTIQRKIGHS